MLKREEYPFIFRLLPGKHGGVLARADGDITGRLGGANGRQQGPEPHAAPALLRSAPALAAVKVCD